MKGKTMQKVSKLFAAAILSIVLAANLHAEEKKKAVIDQVSGQGYGTAGCGLGSIIFGDKPGFIQIIAVTSNGIYGNQTFAISSGTSNCEQKAGSTAAAFIFANTDQLSTDMARGNGETLSNLSGLFGCKDSTMFGKKMQSSYKAIYPTAETPAEHVTNTIIMTIESDKDLSASCTG